LQDELRKKGFAVVGGSEAADTLELNRSYGQAIFKKYGLKTVPLKDFKNPKSALAFARQWPGTWVIKQNNNVNKDLTYIGQNADGSDFLEVLTSYAQHPEFSKRVVSLHKRIEGIEVGVGRFFNGTDWVGPIELNVEHTRLFPGNVGPTTNELGTLAWYTNDENHRLYKETLAKLKPFLQKIHFKGDMALNCIVNENGAYILEATPRLGSPIIHLQTALQISPWGEFLNALARGTAYDLKWRKGYGIVVFIAVPPFPFSPNTIKNHSQGLHFSLANLTPEEKSHVHFEGLALDKSNNERYIITDTYGYLLYVTGIGATIKEAQHKAYSIAEKLVIPNMFYRNDIGVKFDAIDYKKLIEWGYLNAEKKVLPILVKKKNRALAV